MQFGNQRHCSCGLKNCLHNLLQLNVLDVLHLKSYTHYNFFICGQYMPLVKPVDRLDNSNSLQHYLSDKVDAQLKQWHLSAELTLLQSFILSVCDPVTI